MKNIYAFIILFVASLFFTACDSIFKDDYSINNESNNSSTFSIEEKGDEEFTLAPKESKNYTLYEHPRIKILTKEHQAYSYDGSGNITISDMEKIRLIVENQCSKNITITENNDLLENYGDSLTVEKNSTKDFFTYGTDFTVKDSDNIIREYSIKKSEDFVQLTIR